MIAITELNKSFGRNQVLKGINLQIRDGVITAVLGPNASGKTTLIKSILGMVVPQQGTIEMNGKEIRNDWKYRQQIGYLPQIARFPENLKVKELIRMICDIRSSEGNPALLTEMFEIGSVLNKPLRHLSGGTRQKVNILLAFMFDCPNYILDEPTAGLDPLSLIRFKNLLKTERSKGKGILLTTHIVSLVEELADDIVFLLEGNIFFSGQIDEMKTLNGGQSPEQSMANIISRNHV
ncbi:MAG: ABC transporter ATP-binding protein [Bacteroidetes bacterium]|nr:ABC transporter ATP-binding protein [Bacteroidota bacterium]